MSVRLALVAAAAWSALALGGCGFQPMYATQPDGSSVALTLASIEIPEKLTRHGQLVRNALLNDIAPVGQAQAPRYRLDFTVSENEFDISVEKNTDVNRRALTLIADYTLVDLATNKQILSGKTFSRVAYDRIPSEFANIQAHRNALDRAAGEIASNITTRLGAFFSN